MSQPQDPQKEPLGPEVKREIENPEVLVSPETAHETKEAAETRELSPDDIAKLKNTIEGADLADDLKPHVQTTSQNLQTMSDDEKVASLMQQAKAKGVVFAVKVAKGLDNPYVLDKLHDLLAANGDYKEFVK